MSKLGYLLAIGGLGLLAFASMACSGLNAPPVSVTIAASEAAAQPDRFDCAAIFGTPLRSAQERLWFQGACESHPIVQVAIGPPDVDPKRPAQCSALDGRAYSDDSQRQYYLQNCVQATKTGAVGISGPQPIAAGWQPALTATCEVLRRLGLKTSSDHAWYASHCGQ